MKRIVIAMLLLFAAGGATQANAQIWKKAVEAAKKATEKQVEKRTEKAVDKAFEKAEDAVTGKGDNNCQTQQTGQTGQTIGTDQSATSQSATAQQEQSLEMTYAKSDFVPGDEIFFEDLMDNEQLGEFPSMWDLVKGNAEIASINGKNAIVRDPGQTSMIRPLMEDMKNYLPEKFTAEMDVWLTPRNTQPPYKSGNQWYRMYFYDANGREVMSIEFDNRVNYALYWSYKSTSGETVKGEARNPAVNFDGWHHLAFSFNQRAFKIYLDGVRLGNIPNMTQPASFAYTDFPMNSASGGALTNVRFAKGAVPLYDRMMSDGKFITYGITFDVGKSTIKPESMGEINRIVQLMNENPDLKFSVEGHTDSTGSADSNQTLSEARSNAIVDKLVSMGIAADRLTASGKGQNNPIADNSTDEGRAKNRRVEFVKL
jgi:outer membrane protein OmpA-like peptidoglycan-associated protein